MNIKELKELSTYIAMSSLPIVNNELTAVQGAQIPSSKAAFRKFSAESRANVNKNAALITLFTANPNKGTLHTIQDLYETQVWEIPVIIITLEDGSRYSFSDFQFQHEVPSLKIGAKVYVYPMLLEEQDLRRGKFYNAVNWLEDLQGNLWRLDKNRNL